MIRSQTPVLLLIVATMVAVRSLAAAEPIATPPPIAAPDEQVIGNGTPTVEYPSQSSLHFYPAVLETRRFGPVEEPAPEFYALRNSHAPGFDWTSAFGAGWGWGWGSGWPSPGFAIGLVAYNRYFYRPWYTYPSQTVWSNRLPWYSPGGVGPNIYQPWYIQRNSLPWYSPNGIGPNIYTPNYEWQSYYPWYSPNGPGPNIYTPDWQYGGCLYW